MILKVLDNKNDLLLTQVEGVKTMSEGKIMVSRLNRDTEISHYKKDVFVAIYTNEMKLIEVINQRE